MWIVCSHDLSYKAWLENGHHFKGDYEDAEKMLCDIAKALRYLQGQRVLHNDIKPSNILYRRETGAKLIDFGCAQHGPKTRSGRGSPWYTPPEYLAHGYGGFPAEIWGLGIVMIFLLKLMPLPEFSQGWITEDIKLNHKDKTELKDIEHKKGVKAKQAMGAWLTTVRRVRSMLPKNAVAETVYKMLDGYLDTRVQAQELVTHINNQG
ncbi:kinase-like domain-containing protein [Microdochium trichocladiopsis]|uniref:Kinase-like domain-containing protein n=1 Tax=Microdochium trichocladiopsis TaxID=1682393 RepID=A0A9P8XTR9_9PEZI|nr:kinase-like domain-containing protein [Microdochium trichocladiopsis]KAH7016414.1 kinase-like domain-containing protein [Microdochium trichocladiopsis]